MIFMAVNENKGTGDLDKELEALSQPKAVAVPSARKSASRAAPAAKAPKAPGAKVPAKKKAVLARGKRKRAIARATLTPGSGRILINGVDVKIIKPDIMRELMLEPVKISPQAQGISNSSDIYVNVVGGGRSGQAQAVRTAIAKVIVNASGGDSLKRAYMAYDRTLMVDDYRRVEPKKFLGPKARAKFQKSYR